MEQVTLKPELVSLCTDAARTAGVNLDGLLPGAFDKVVKASETILQTSRRDIERLLQDAAWEKECKEQQERRAVEERYEKLRDLKQRYYLFDFADYYPNGGLADVVATSNFADDLIQKAKERRGENIYVWDKITDTTLWEKYGEED